MANQLAYAICMRVLFHGIARVHSSQHSPWSGLLFGAWSAYGIAWQRRRDLVKRSILVHISPEWLNYYLDGLQPATETYVLINYAATVIRRGLRALTRRKTSANRVLGMFGFGMGLGLLHVLEPTF